MKGFLDRFQFEQITLQYVNNSTDKGNIVEIVTPKQFQANQKKYQQLNQQGYEFFFMVNEGDGVTIPTGLRTARNQEAVKRLTALFIDADGCPANKINFYLKTKKLKPHIIVESSPGKYHYYFLLSYTENNPLNLSRWKACQRALMYLGDPSRPDTGCDTHMTDHARILRVPGLFHLKDKSKPYLTNIKEDYHHTYYDLAELTEKLDAKMFVKQDYHKYQFPEGRIGLGSRHGEMMSYFGHMINKGVDPEIVLQSFYGIAAMKFDQPEDFFPGGKREKEVTDGLNYVVQQNRSETITNSLAILSDAKSSTDPYALPDDFYLSAPGIAGEIVNEIYRAAHYPCASITFATALGLLGTLKCHNVSPSGLTPSNYFICLADSGIGKNYPQEVMDATFNHLEIGNLLGAEVRSAQGLYRTLKKGDGRVFLMLDELKEFFSAFANTTGNQQYLTQCEGILLKLYTSTGRALYKTGDLAKEDGLTFSYPCLNMTAFGVPENFKSAFTLDSLTRGLLSRCLVISIAERFRKKNPNGKQAKHLNGNIESYLRTQHISMMDYFSELQDNHGAPLNTIPYADGVQEKHEAYCQKLDDRYNELSAVGEHKLKVVFTRGAEQVIRVALALADDVITHEIYDYALRFVHSRIEANYSLVDKTFNKSELSQDIEYLVDKISEFMRKEGRPMRYREIVRKTKFRKAKDAKDIIRSAQETQHIKKVLFEVNKQQVEGFILDEVI